MVWNGQKYFSISKETQEQDGPSLESSSYLNVSLRYLGPLDPGTLGPLDLGTLGPLDSWTSSLHIARVVANQIL